MIYLMFLRILHWIHKRVFFLMLVSYGLASFFPGPGLEMESFRFFENSWNSDVEIRIPTLFLFCMLVISGFGLSVKEIQSVKNLGKDFLFSISAFPLIPLLATIGLFSVSGFWNHPNQINSIIVAVVILASMPIASSASAWTFNSKGNMALCILLILASSILAPILEPFFMEGVSEFTHIEFSHALLAVLKGSGSSYLFLTISVPVAIGVVIRNVLKENLIQRILPFLKGSNALLLLFLNYMNASVTLPALTRHPSFPIFATVLFVSFIYIAMNFLGAFFLANRIFRMRTSEAVAATFSLGMRNNGAGLTLAALTIHNFPIVLLTIMAVNLWQQLGASFLESRFTKGGEDSLDSASYRIKAGAF